MPSTPSRVARPRTHRRVAAAAAALAAATVAGAVAPALAADSTAPATAVPALPPVRAGWAGQIGTTVLKKVIKAAGADKADKRDPDLAAGATGEVLTGRGVGVALIDSGVSPVPGLDGKDKLVHGPDLSFESQSDNLRNLDTYGHGTHMAGIIAGQDPATAGTDRFDGVAPGARLVSLKVAAADGATDVSQVVAAIDWVIEHRDDAGTKIRVLNLSYGTHSRQPATFDPLAYAVERAWKAGIVVVVAAGNDGWSAPSLTMPAANPDVIAVGAADPMGTDTRADDTLAEFTNRGNRVRHPDVLAAGRSVVSLRVPGSFIDQAYPGARLSENADPRQRFLRGSGTSQAAAVVSGTVALLLEQRPNLTPDQVKKLLMDTATPVSAPGWTAGAGQIDVSAAARTRTPVAGPQLNLPATGLGSLEAARGDAHVYDPATGQPLVGEQDIFGRPWAAPVWVTQSMRADTWKDGRWNGTVWTGRDLRTEKGETRYWDPARWTTRTWSGQSWTDAGTDVATWSGRSWSGRSWSGRSWSGRSWSGRSWSSADWPEVPWQ